MVEFSFNGDEIGSIGAVWGLPRRDEGHDRHERSRFSLMQSLSVSRATSKFPADRQHPREPTGHGDPRRKETSCRRGGHEGITHYRIGRLVGWRDVHLGHPAVNPPKCSRAVISSSPIELIGHLREKSTARPQR